MTIMYADALTIYNSIREESELGHIANCELCVDNDSLNKIAGDYYRIHHALLCAKSVNHKNHFSIRKCEITSDIQKAIIAIHHPKIQALLEHIDNEFHHADNCERCTIGNSQNKFMRILDFYFDNGFDNYKEVQSVLNVFKRIRDFNHNYNEFAYGEF